MPGFYLSPQPGEGNAKQMRRSAKGQEGGRVGLQEIHAAIVDLEAPRIKNEFLTCSLLFASVRFRDPPDTQDGLGKRWRTRRPTGRLAWCL